MRSLFTILFLSLTILTPAQNLVNDGSLEDTIKCPQSSGRFYHPTNTNEQYLTHWRSTTLASPDYHNTCGFNSSAPRTGEGYAGILYYDASEVREYITCSFSKPLEIGKQYIIEYYVALSPGSTIAIDQMNLHLSNGVPLDQSFPPPAPYGLSATLTSSFIPTDTSYQKIADCYFADGGETHMTFGNFFDNANTDTTQVKKSGSISSYYFIDDVSVIEFDESATIIADSIFANMEGATYEWQDCENNNFPIPGETNRVFKPTQSGVYAVKVTYGNCSGYSECIVYNYEGIDSWKNQLTFTPNPSSGKFFISGLNTTDIISIYNLNGQSIPFNQVGNAITLKNDVKGLYFMKVQRANKLAIKKIMIY